MAFEHHQMDEPEAKNMEEAVMISDFHQMDKTINAGYHQPNVKQNKGARHQLGQAKASKLKKFLRQTENGDE